MEIEDAVERYVSLQQQIKALETELDELKSRIISFCQVEGLNRLYGKENALTYQLVEMTGFDEPEVRMLLEPLGLWGKVLSFDQTKLKQLLTDESVIKDVKKKIEKIRKVVSASPRLWVRKIKESE